jgi:signal transduction histidine kinase
MLTRWVQRFPIYIRLRIFFAAVVLLMLLGSIVSFWQFYGISAYATRVTRTQERASALLRLNTNLLAFMSHLHRVADDRVAHRFEIEAPRLLNIFRQQTASAAADLDDIAKGSPRHAVLVGAIRTMLESLPSRIEALRILARGGDWITLHARLLNQADQTDDVVALLMEQVDSDMATARISMTKDLENAQQVAVRVLTFTTLLSLAAAALLGTFMARSITQPLTRLSQGATALAAGGFQHRIQVDGTDELAQLASTFNHTGAELQRLFDDVQSERSSAEAARAALQERAQELSRANTDLQQFAYSASHDLQEPLRVLALYSQLLRRKYVGQFDENADEYFQYLDRAARQSQQLIADLLAYTQAGRLDKETAGLVNANTVFERVLSTFELQIRSNSGDVSAAELPCVRAHEIHVQQLLQNLIGNALKYRSADRDPRIRISAERRDDKWVFAVADNGIGIEARYLTQIFGLFKRLHGQQYSGTGIGLAICQRIVETYQGSIWVESEPGIGSTFLFTLPAA